MAIVTRKRPTRASRKQSSAATAGEQDQLLRCAVLWSATGNEDALIELRSTGASDVELRAAITAALGDSGSADTGGGVCWTGGRTPAIWFGCTEIPARRNPDLTGKALLNAVRKLLNIPQPGQGDGKATKPAIANDIDEPSTGQPNKPARKPQARPSAQRAGNQSTKSAGKPTTKQPATQAAPTSASEQEIPIEKITASPLNPRQSFDKNKLAELAASIKAHGLLQALVVWTTPEGQLELIAGERRWRACRLAKLTTVRCRVLDVTPAQAVELRGIENLQREDLNPIEEARWFEQMLNRCGYTQARLAKRLKCSQPKIGNALALLRLPAAWLDRIITQEITATHARYLVPWCERPQVLERMENFLGNLVTTPTVDEFQHEVGKVVRTLTKPVAKQAVGGPKFNVTPKRRAELDVVEVPANWGGGKEARAFNVALWNQLQREAEKKARQTDTHAAGDQAAGKSSAGKQTGEKDSPASNKTNKDLAAPDAVPDTAAPDPEPSEWRLQELWRIWFCHTLAEKLSKRDKPLVSKCLLFLLSKCDLYETLDAALRHVCTGSSSAMSTLGAWLETAETWTLISSVADKQFPAAELELLRQLLVTGGAQDIDLEILYELATTCAAGCDPVAEWEPTYEWLELFSVRQLQSMPATRLIKVEIFADLDKPDLIERLLENWQPGFIPQPVVDALPELSPAAATQATDNTPEGDAT